MCLEFKSSTSPSSPGELFDMKIKRQIVVSGREADGLKTITNLFQIVSYPSAGNVGNQKINSLKSDCSSRKAAISIIIIEPSFSFAIFPLDQCFNLF